MSVSRCVIVVAVGVIAASTVKGQVVPPFFSPGVASFEPQIGIVQSGVVQDVQAVVSPDRKYVTLNMQVQNTNLLALHEFTFQTAGTAAPLGVVGIPPAAALQPARPSGSVSHSNTTGGGASNTVSASASEIRRRADAYVLERQGVFRVGSAP
jgi:hypothetical protein